MFTLSAPAQAGFFSSVLKAGKHVDAPDSLLVTGNKLAIDHLHLPLDAKIPPDIVEVKLGVGQQWVYRTPKGQPITAPDALANPVLIIDKVYLPKDLHLLNSLPQQLPILIRDGSTLLELKRNDLGTWQLRSGKVHIDTPDHPALMQSIAHLKAPWGYHKVKILNTQTTPEGSYPAFKLDTLLHTPSHYKGQTLVLGGTLQGDHLLTLQGKSSLTQLQAIAKEQDITLLIFDSPKPLNADKLSAELSKISEHNSPLSTAAFLSQFHAQGPSINYQITHSLNGQTFIRTVRTTEATPEPSPAAAHAVSTLSSLTIRSSLVIRPDEERRRELDNRIFPWLHSSISFYLIISSVAGYLFFGTCRQCMRRLWPLTLREHYQPKWLYSGYRLVRLLCLLTIIMPLFGLPCAIGRIVYTCYRVVRWIIVRLWQLIHWLLRPLFG